MIFSTMVAAHGTNAQYDQANEDAMFEEEMSHRESQAEGGVQRNRGLSASAGSGAQGPGRSTKKSGSIASNSNTSEGGAIVGLVTADLEVDTEDDNVSPMVEEELELVVPKRASVVMSQSTIQMINEGGDPSKKGQPKETPFDEMDCRTKTFYLMDGFNVDAPPRWENASFFITNFTAFIISVSVIIFLISTLPHYELTTTDKAPLRGIEAGCMAYFVVEFFTRFVCAPKQKEFWASGLTWIDVLSIVPYFILLAVENVTDSAGILSAFRVLRLARVIRVMKFFKNNIGFLAVWEAVNTSREALSLMLMMLIIALVSFSSFIYFGELEGSTFSQEKGLWIRYDGTISPFQSVFHSMWWCIATVTTVGYGDETPVTGYGKAVGGLTAITGVFVISFPTAILGANFAEIHNRMVVEKRMKERVKERMRRAVAGEASFSPASSPLGGVPKGGVGFTHQAVNNDPNSIMNSNNFAQPGSPNPLVAFGQQPHPSMIQSPPQPHMLVQVPSSSKDSPAGSPPQATSLGNAGKEISLHQNLGGAGQHASASSWVSDDKGQSQVKRTYVVDEKGSTREMWITQDLGDDGALFATEVQYGPALILKHAPGRPDALLVKAEESFPEGEGRRYHLTLVLADNNVVDLVKDSLENVHHMGLPSDSQQIRPKRIDRLTVELVPCEEFEGLVTLSTREFHKPRGSVNLTLVVESKECDRHFLRHISVLAFRFKVRYEEESTYGLPPGNFTTAKLSTAATGRDLETPTGSRATSPRGSVCQTSPLSLRGSQNKKEITSPPNLAATARSGDYDSPPLTLPEPLTQQ